MPKVRRNAQKWARNSQTAGQSYIEGVEDPKREWEPAAIEGEELFGSVMQSVITNRSREKGIQRVGQKKYDTGVREKGLTRFRQAVGLPSSLSNYNAGFEPFAKAIETVELPPKQPKGQNLSRVQAIQDALIAEKARQIV